MSMSGFQVIVQEEIRVRKQERREMGNGKQAKTGRDEAVGETKPLGTDCLNDNQKRPRVENGR